MTFLVTGNETEGQLLQIDMSVRPAGFAAAEHVHPLQQERFLIKEGQITLRIAGNEQHYKAGDEVTIPAGTPHVWWNGGKEELRVILEFRPAGRFDQFIATFFALAHAGKTDARGLPRNPLQLAVTFRAYRDVIYGTRPPVPVQKVLFALLDPIGRFLGYQCDVPYSERGSRGRRRSNTGLSGEAPWQPGLVRFNNTLFDGLLLACQCSQPH